MHVSLTPASSGHDLLETLQPNVYLEITFKDITAYPGDIGDQAAVDAFEAVTEKVICDAACQNQARVRRGEIRRLLGTEVIREITFKNADR